MMRQPYSRVETKGSFWLFDDMGGQFCRMPKREGPRNSPVGEDWGGPGAGILRDLVWQPFQAWDVTDARKLLIFCDNDGNGIVAPDAIVQHDARVGV